MLTRPSRSSAAAGASRSRPALATLTWVLASPGARWRAPCSHDPVAASTVQQLGVPARVHVGQDLEAAPGAGAVAHADVNCRSVATAGIPLLGQSPREGLPLTSRAAERLACDAAVARLVFGPDGVPLDLGRSQRLFSPAQRRALAIRDGGCRFPGCTRPPRFTDAHHVVPWSQGGASDLHNALLLCRHHHRLVHEGDWRIVNPVGAGPVSANEPIALRGPAGQLLTEARAP